MTRTGPNEHRGRDLDTPEEITEFVTRFYREIAQDDRFHLYFETIAHVDWHAHTLTLADFWVGLLLDDRDSGPQPDASVVIEDHRWLHEKVAFDQELFDRWLEIFDATLDDGWVGPVTNQARKRGHGYAWAMSKRLTGTALRPSTDPAA